MVWALNGIRFLFNCSTGVWMLLVAVAANTTAIAAAAAAATMMINDWF